MLDDNEYLIIMSKNLSMLRAKASLTQAQLADNIGIPRTTYSAIENKKRKMTFAVFVNLSKYFLSNKETVDIMNLLGLSEKTLNQFFYIDKLIKKTERKKVAAFGGNRVSEDDNNKQRTIEKTIKGIDK